MRLNAASESIRVVAAIGLPGVEPVDRMHLSADLIAVAATHRIQGSLWAAIVAGWVAGNDDRVAQARESYLAALRTSLVAEETAVLAIEALESAGIACRLLKGVALSHLDYPEPSDRIFGDADLLVERGRCAAALEALGRASFERVDPPVRSWWERRFGKAILLRAPNGGELDLHLRLTGGYFGEMLDHRRLWSASPDAVQLGGCVASALAQGDRLLNACCHVSLGGGSGLRAQRDVAQLLTVRQTDWQRCVELATADGIDLVFASAIGATWQSLALDPTHPAALWAAAHVASPVQRRALAQYDEAFATGWAPEGRGMLPALSPIERVRFLAGLAVPSRASMRARGRTWRQHLRLGASAVRGRP